MGFFLGGKREYLLVWFEWRIWFSFDGGKGVDLEKGEGLVGWLANYGPRDWPLAS